METAINNNKHSLTDGDLQWVSQNFHVLNKMSVPNTKNIWFKNKYQKYNAVLKYLYQYDEKSLESMIEQIQTQINQWNHPNIVKVYDYDFNEKDHYSFRFVICMERGLFSLKDELSKRNRLDHDQVWNLMQQMVKALHYAQQNFNCHHGNIKPSNIICFSEEDEIYKLSEFRSESIDLTRADKMPAKLETLLQNEYLAPEYKSQNGKGKNGLNPFSNDVYALGILALDAMGYKVEFLRGLSPDSEEAEYFFACVFADLYKKINFNFFNILQMMLNKDPSKRQSLEGVYEVFVHDEAAGQATTEKDFGYAKAALDGTQPAEACKEFKRPKVHAALKLADIDKLWSIPVREFKSIKANKWMDKKGLRTMKLHLYDF